MKSHHTFVRLQQFQLAERRRRVAQIETMIADFQRMAADLEGEIAAEQQRTGIHDPSHFAYPTYAKAAIARRDNLRRSAGELASQLEEAKLAVQEIFEYIQRAELLVERDQDRINEMRVGANAEGVSAVRAGTAVSGGLHLPP